MEKTKEFYIKHLEECFEKTNNDQSKITDKILAIEGKSGKRTRHLYNNILNMEDAKYLEIGTWIGSTVCAAMYNNNATVVCIDNWSEFNGEEIKTQFFKYFNEFKGENNATFIEQDCFNVDVNILPKFNVYMYDGGHSYAEHFKSITYYLNCLDDIFILIVDDWNISRIRNGTRHGIKESKLKLLWYKEIILSENDTDQLKDKNWWNGICVFLLEKPKMSNEVIQTKCCL